MEDVIRGHSLASQAGPSVAPAEDTVMFTSSVARSQSSQVDRLGFLRRRLITRFTFGAVKLQMIITQ